MSTYECPWCSAIHDLGRLADDPQQEYSGGEPDTGQCPCWSAVDAVIRYFAAEPPKPKAEDPH